MTKTIEQVKQVSTIKGFLGYKYKKVKIKGEKRHLEDFNSEVRINNYWFL